MKSRLAAKAKGPAMYFAINDLWKTFIDSTQKGLLEIELAEGVKLQLCNILNHLYDIELRHRIESLIAFAEGFIAEGQQV